MSYFNTHRKCAFCGVMLFDDDVTLIDRTAGRSQPSYFCDESCRMALVEDWPVEEVARRITKWRRRDDEPAVDIDPVTTELVRGGLEFIVGQMARTMQRSAYSPVFAEAHDFTCAFFDAGLELVAQHQGLPGHLGSLRFAVPWAIRALDVQALNPGDVIIHNDPYRGAPHLPEVTVIRPLFSGDALVAYAATTAHQIDTGGKSPGSMPGDATEIYQEGLIIPPVKLFDRGRECGDVFRLLLANVRTPRSSYGDVSAMCGSLVTAERLFGELVERHSLPVLLRCFERIKQHGEQRMRAAIATLPEGVWRGECWVDDDGVTPEPHRIAVTLAILGGSVIADFRGSAPQARGPINAAYAVTHAAALNSVLQVLAAGLPINEGIHRPLRVIAPPGTIVNVDHPGPLNSGNTETHNLFVEAMLDALRQAALARTCAPCGSTTNLMTGGAWNPDTREPYTLVTWEVAGWGAMPHADGNSAMGRFGSMIVRNIPVEVHETQFPWRIRYWELRVDSGGAGRFRGDLGGRREYELLAPELTFGVNSNRARFAPQGVAGGHPSLPTRWWVRRDATLLAPDQLGSISPDKFNGLRIAAGESIISECPGGGGWGQPSLRPRELVREDLKQGYISKEQAVDVYGLDAEDAGEIVAEFHWGPRT